MSLVEPISITGSPPLLQMLLDRLRTARLRTPITTTAGTVSTLMAGAIGPIAGISTIVMRGALGVTPVTRISTIVMRAIRPTAGISTIVMRGALGVTLVASVRIGPTMTSISLPIMMGLAPITLMGPISPVTGPFVMRGALGVTLMTSISTIVMRAIGPIAGVSTIVMRGALGITLVTGVSISPTMTSISLPIMMGAAVTLMGTSGPITASALHLGIGVTPVTGVRPVVMRAIRPIAGTPRITAAAGISSIRTGTVLTTDTSTIRRTGTTITDAPTGRALSGMRTLRRRSISRARRRPQTRPRLRNIDVLTLRRTCAHLGHIHAGRINHPTIRDIHIHTRHIDPGRRIRTGPPADHIIEIEIQVQRRLDLPGNIAGWDLDQLPDPSTHRIQERQNTINRDRDLPGTSQPRTRRPELPSLTRPSSSTNKQSPNHAPRHSTGMAWCTIRAVATSWGKSQEEHPRLSVARSPERRVTLARP